MHATILVVDDEESIRTSLAGVLEDEGYSAVLAVDGVEALELVQREVPDLVLLDIWMPRLDGLETLQRLRAVHPSLTVIMISGHGTIETAVRATKLGAYDFIEKPLSLEKVILTVSNALGTRRLEEENASLRSIVLHDHNLIGVSTAMSHLTGHVAMVAPTAASVLVSGESGSGKETVARAIHYESQRRDKPFIEVNCASIPEQLIESELFGHERGAFPGATSLKKGKFDVADGGTLFLDEIGDVPLAVQPKVLRVLQEGRFERVGGTRTIQVDVRIIAATTRPLDEEVRGGRFRDDLYYALSVVPLRVPALRERREDISHLIDYYLEDFSHREGRERKVMAKEAVALLQEYDWPGNVRELKNIVERLVIMTPGSAILATQLPEYFTGRDGREPGGGKPVSTMETNSLREAREEFEKEFILQKLEENSWDISSTAEAIELERSNLQRKIKSYGIDLKKQI